MSWQEDLSFSTAQRPDNRRHDAAGWCLGRCHSKHGSTGAAHRMGPACLAPVLRGNVHLNGHAAVGAGDPLPARAALGIHCWPKRRARALAQRVTAAGRPRSTSACCPKWEPGEQSTAMLQRAEIGGLDAPVLPADVVAVWIVHVRPLLGAHQQPHRHAHALALRLKEPARWVG